MSTDRARLAAIFKEQEASNNEITAIIKRLFPIGCTVEFERREGKVLLKKSGTVISHKKQGGLGRTSLIVQCDGKRLTKTVSQKNLNGITRI